ncbi:hypothetical protein [Streptomyces sp. B1-3]|uniref:hypothetical protein n=1 Tax=Streptomyces sp. B1-3 TaxID=3141453 RepID=UPI003D2C9610
MSAPSTREVYALLDADGTVRYVGVSANARGRVANHWGSARRYPADGRPLAVWLRTLDGPPAFNVLERVPVEAAGAAEAAWIRRLRRDPAARLVNLRPYEDLTGLPGVDPAAAARGSLARVSAAMRGHPVSAETRRRLSLATRGRPKSPEHRAAIAASVTAWHASRREAPVDVS